LKKVFNEMSNNNCSCMNRLLLMNLKDREEMRGASKCLRLILKRTAIPHLLLKTRRQVPLNLMHCLMKKPIWDGHEDDEDEESGLIIQALLSNATPLCRPQQYKCKTGMSSELTVVLSKAKLSSNCPDPRYVPQFPDSFGATCESKLNELSSSVGMVLLVGGI